MSLIRLACWLPSGRNVDGPGRVSGSVRSIQARDYHELATPSSPRLSPAGDRVAFLRTQPDDAESYESTVYVGPADASDPPQRFTLREGQDAEPRWSPSGDRLAFTSTRGDADDRQQLWVMPVAGGEARQVTAVVGGVSSIAWSPDGTRIAFLQSVTPDDREADRDLAVDTEYEPDTPDPRVIDRTVYRSQQEYFDGQRSQLYLVDLETDTVTRLTDDERDYAAPEWGTDETLYVAVSVGADPDDSSEYEILAYDTTTATSRPVTRTYGWGIDISATPDGRLAFPYQPPADGTIGQTELQVFDPATDTTRTITTALDRAVGRGGLLTWGPDFESVYFSTPDSGAVAIWVAPGDGTTTPTQVFRGGTIADVDIGSETGESPTDIQVAVAMSDWNHPGDVFVVRNETRRQLTALNDELLSEVAIAEPEPLTIDGPDGEIDGWLLTPPEPSEHTAPYPLLVEVHGGPHHMWTTAGTMWHEFQTLAARGYAVFWSNPRGSDGYGEEFLQAIKRDWGPTTLADVTAGVEQVIERPAIDEDELFLTGGSFGGFMTAWTVGQTDRFTAAVSQRGVYDLTGFYGSTDGAYKLVEDDFNTTPWEEPEFLFEQSPVGHADQVQTPTLLIHSERDYRTPIAPAELYYRTLRKHDVDTRLVRYPREGHELSRSGEPAHVVDRIERIARWFDGYSTHHDVPVATDRGDAGLTASDEDTQPETR